MKASGEWEKQAVGQVMALMCAAARTAPKTRGMDQVRVVAIDDEPTKAKVVAKMRDIAERDAKPTFARDAGNLAACPGVVVIGVADKPVDLNCGFCGHPTCESLQADQGMCAFNSIDLGIAVSSAAAVAGQHHIDNRIMYSIGRACMELNLFDADVRQALGVPLSVTGKSPFFDRK